MEDYRIEEAFNALSYVIQNRPRPISEADVFLMKTGDILRQTGRVASWADDQDLLLLGDEDMIGVSIAYFRKKKLIEFGPKRILVLDYDERIVSAVKRFADREGIGEKELDAARYNVVDPIPGEWRTFSRFHANPPWGLENDGESVKVFMQRGFEAMCHDGEAMLVLADEDDLSSTARVMENAQSYALQNGFHVVRFDKHAHNYHHGRGVDPVSSNLYLRSRGGNFRKTQSEAIVPSRLRNFYGKEQTPTIRYIKETKDPNYGRASPSEYELESFGDGEAG